MCGHLSMVAKRLNLVLPQIMLYCAAAIYCVAEDDLTALRSVKKAKYVSGGEGHILCVNLSFT